ncbi:hypothetical protein [Scopulibacillus daqui]|uniref:hypothetical protein n=1 Tax=Scopulibacillus daqui TaxID=1469162 RepID=UPI00195F53F1|nr:hypothetical protein [Scopulibacillus daqui]
MGQSRLKLAQIFETVKKNRLKAAPAEYKMATPRITSEMLLTIAAVLFILFALIKVYCREDRL